MKFKDALKQKDFVITAQPNLAAGPDAESLLAQAKILSPVVDGVQLTDKSSTRLQMSGVAAAALLLPLGIDPIVHISCRDRNRIAMDKDLVGAAALGVSSVIVKRGRKITNTEKTGARNVYDITAHDFVAYIDSLKQAENSVLGTDFLVGSNANLMRPNSDWVPNKLFRKCDAGVNFFQAPICFDMDVVRNYMARIVELKLTHRASFLMAVSPLPDADTARWMRDNVSSSHMPDAIIERMDNAPDPETEGVAICAELLQELAEIPGISGANILTLGQLETIPAAVEASGVREMTA